MINTNSKNKVFLHGHTSIDFFKKGGKIKTTEEALKHKSQLCNRQGCILIIVF